MTSRLDLIRDSSRGADQRLPDRHGHHDPACGNGGFKPSRPDHIIPVAAAKPPLMPGIRSRTVGSRTDRSRPPVARHTRAESGWHRLRLVVRVGAAWAGTSRRGAHAPGDPCAWAKSPSQITSTSDGSSWRRARILPHRALLPAVRGDPPAVGHAPARASIAERPDRGGTAGSAAGVGGLTPVPPLGSSVDAADRSLGRWAVAAAVGVTATEPEVEVTPCEFVRSAARCCSS